MASSTPASTLYKDIADSSAEFRTIRLCPAQHDEPISCVLENAVRSDNPQYVALSYSWGPRTNDKTISINGQDFIATANCESALRCIRKTDDPVTLWVDAICINQENLGERSAQVAQMREIYKQAAHVIIWLGCEDSDTSPAFELLEQISELGRYDPLVATSETVGTAAAWQAVENLFTREWFERIWVVQEASLAKSITIQCGRHVMSWTTFNRALQWYHKDIGHVNRGLTRTDSLLLNALEVRNAWAKRQYGSRREPNLESLLAQFSNWKATDLRDKVNGLLGMSDEHAVPELQPDYTKSVCETYTKVVKYLITRDKRLSILGQVDNPAMYMGEPPENKRLPSWVPDWTPDRPYRNRLSETYRPEGDSQVMVTSTGMIMIPGGLNMPGSGYGTWEQDSMVREEMNFKASLDLLADCCFPTGADSPIYYRGRGPEFDPEGTMSLKGIKVDTVHSVTVPLFRAKEDLDDPAFFLEWEKFAILQAAPDAECPYGGSFEDKLDAFWRTLTTDRIYTERSNLRARPVCRELFEQWRAGLTRNANPADAHRPETADTVDYSDESAASRLLYGMFAQLHLSGDAPPDLLRDYEAWKHHLSQLESRPPEPPNPAPSGPPEEYTLPNLEASLRIWCFARKLARTSSGRLALVPEHTQPGDHIYVLYGGSVPYVARPLPGRGTVKGYWVDELGERGEVGAAYRVIMPMHQFVGEAYVHGIMDGEALGYPPIQRTQRLRRVEVPVSGARGEPEFEALDSLTVFKYVPDPLTPEQEELVAKWREGLRAREQDVWFDHVTSVML
ncbi:hypothetical protein JX266_008694 [Neoarthrinium moseri]|nr:hypothetical protein JX266_008694 [Neoarthrinium moseri]